MKKWCTIGQDYWHEGAAIQQKQVREELGDECRIRVLPRGGFQLQAALKNAPKITKEYLAGGAHKFPNLKAALAYAKKIHETTGVFVSVEELK
jgi:hypothetical protein